MMVWEAKNSNQDNNTPLDCQPFINCHAIWKLTWAGHLCYLFFKGTTVQICTSTRKGEANG